MARVRRIALIAAAATIAVGGIAAGCGDDSSSSSDTSGGGGSLSGEIAGAGASSQAAAQEVWRAGFQEQNSGATVSYDPVGSGGGREQFVAGGIAFAGTDAAFADEELAGASKRCGGTDNLVEIPVYISPIAVAYNLPSVENLQLSPETLAKIMKGDITTWNDAAIAADNPGVDLPSTKITVVSRSDESGTTENFQQYLKAAAPSVWTYEPDGNWPVKGGESAQGTSGVVAAIGAGEGTIGYADESQVGDLGTASVKVGANYVGPSAEAAAKILDESPRTTGTGQYVFTYDLKRDTTTEGIYPIVLTSYAAACSSYSDANTAALVKGYFNYIISPEGQQAASEQAGSAPLSDTQREQLQPAVDAIGS